MKTAGLKRPAFVVAIKSGLAVAVMIVVAVVIVMAAFARLFEIVAFLFCLPAVFSVFVNGFFKVCLGLVNAFLTPVVIPVQGPRRNRPHQKAKCHEKRQPCCVLLDHAISS